MASQAVFTKTDAGRDEIQTRARKLPPGLRSILLLVDGQRDAAQLRRVAEGLHAPPDALETLATLGLITAVGGPAANAGEMAHAPAVEDAGQSEVARRFSALSGLLSEAVGQHLGLRGYFTQLKIERCSNYDELIAVAQDLHAALVKAKGQPFADRWKAGMQAAGLL